MARRSGLIKAAVGLVALGVVGVLFVRSARSVRAEPFNVSRDRLARWTLAIEPPSSASGVLLGLRPQRELASALFNDVFARTGESLSGPLPPAIPLILQGELDVRAAGTLGPDALVSLARAAGFESATLEPRCMAHRRVSAPGINRQVYFVLFDSPAVRRVPAAGLTKAARGRSELGVRASRSVPHPDRRGHRRRLQPLAAVAGRCGQGLFRADSRAVNPRLIHPRYNDMKIATPASAPPQPLST